MEPAFELRIRRLPAAFAAVFEVRAVRVAVVTGL
jgi:hypothetical protein